MEHEILKEIYESEGPVGASYLALKIDASQATIGRIMQKLEYNGYIKKQSNKGRSLTKRGILHLQDLYRAILRFQHAEEFLRDDQEKVSFQYVQNVLAVRKILEQETAALAARNITDEQIGELKGIIEEQGRKLSQGLPGDEEDLSFHTYIAKVSGNVILMQILPMILYEKGIYAVLTHIRKKTPTPLVVEHRKVIEALEKRDEKMAAHYMVAHIEAILKDVESILEKDPKKEMITAQELVTTVSKG